MSAPQNDTPSGISLDFVTLDVFTATRYYGNPLAIIQVPATVTLSQTQKQAIAREFNLSEIVFLHEQNEPERHVGDVRADIFTAIAEVPFAGHPTVGTSNYLLRHLKDDPSDKFKDIKALQLKAGRFPITRTRDGTGIEVKLAHDVRIHNSPFADCADFGHYPVVSIVKGMTFILAQQATLEDLAKPTENLLGTANTYKSNQQLDEGWRQGLITSYFYVDLAQQSGSDGGETGVRQLRTRALGSREDPATGSAASALCSYLSLSEKEGPRVRKFHVTQGVEMGRKSDIYIQITLTEGGKAIEEVLLSGTAVKVMEGRLVVPDS